MVEFGADSLELAVASAKKLESRYKGNLITDRGLMDRIWASRETGAAPTSLKLKTPDGPDPVVGWEDAAVDPLRLGDYLREFQALVDRYGYRTSLCSPVGA